MRAVYCGFLVELLHLVRYMFLSISVSSARIPPSTVSVGLDNWLLNYHQLLCEKSAQEGDRNQALVS